MRALSLATHRTWFMSPGLEQAAHARAWSHRWRFAAPVVVSSGHASSLVITRVTLPAKIQSRTDANDAAAGAGQTVDDCSRLAECN